MSKFEWVLPLENNKGKQVDYFKPARSDGVMVVYFKDGSSATYFTETGDTQSQYSINYQKWDYLMKTNPVVPYSEFSDQVLARKLRTMDADYTSMFNEMTRRGFTMLDIDGDALTTYPIAKITKTVTTTTEIVL